MVGRLHLAPAAGRPRLWCRIISLVTDDNIRYEGFLADLNPEGSSIGLRSVYSLGTEGRKIDGPQILASVEVSEYRLFLMSEIKDLKLKMSDPVQHAKASHNVPALIKTHHSQFAPFSSGHSAGSSISRDANSWAFQYGFQRPDFHTMPSLLQLGNTRMLSSTALPPSALAFQMPPQYDGSSALNHQISVDHAGDREAAVIEDDGTFFENSCCTPVVPELHPRGWSCLKEAQEEPSDNGSHNKYQVGSLHFADRQYSTLFYGKGFLESVIKPSIPKTTENERGCSTNFFSKPLYSSVYSRGCRARSSSIGQRFLHFLQGFKQANSQNPFYKGSVVSMIYEGSCTLKANFSHIKEYDPTLAAELCSFFESVRRDLNLAARFFIEEFNNEAEAFCSKKFENFGNLIVCIEGLPAPNRFVSLEAFAQIPGNNFSEARNICSGGSSMVVADTTSVGRVTGMNILEHIFKNHAAKRTWNGKFDLRTIFLTNGMKVEIRAPYHSKFTLDAALNDLIRYAEDVIPMFRVDKLGLPAFFNHLGKYLRRFNTSHFDFPNQMMRFHRFALLSLAFKGPMRRTTLFRGLYRIRQTRHVRALMRSILRSRSFRLDWQSISGLQRHPMLRRVFNHKNDGRDSGMSCPGATEGPQVGEKFPNNTPDGVLVYVRHANEHGSDGPRPEDIRPEEEEEEEDEGDIQLLSDIDLLCSHYLQEYSPYILEGLIFSEDISDELNALLEEVFEEYSRPECLDQDVF